MDSNQTGMNPVSMITINPQKEQARDQTSAHPFASPVHYGVSYAGLATTGWTDWPADSYITPLQFWGQKYHTDQQYNTFIFSKDSTSFLSSFFNDVPLECDLEWLLFSFLSSVLESSCVSVLGASKIIEENPISYLNWYLILLENLMKISSVSVQNFIINTDNVHINPFPIKPWFLCVCSASLLKTLREKKKLLVTSNFSFSQCFLHVEELSAIFIKFEIIVFKVFEFGTV